MASHLARAVLLASLAGASAHAQTPPAGPAPVVIAIDAAAGRHPINPMIYGVAFATTADLTALRAPLNRSGGNNTSTYSFANNAQNLDFDYFFESYPQAGTAPGAAADAFVALSQAGQAQPMLTVPLIGWVAKLGAKRTLLPSFSVRKYGAQCGVDPYDPDAGNGLRGDCAKPTPITGNDPADAYVPDSPRTEAPWIRHLVAKWGRAAAWGVRWYLMDNEPSLWFSTHRDIHPVGPHAVEYRDKVLRAAATIRAIDPGARIVGPEEWGWEGYFYSGYDQQYAPLHGYTSYPDHAGPQGGADYLPWLLAQWKKAHAVDVVSLHFYPQGGEFSDDVSPAAQLLRNRSTRQLWDRAYVSESWIGQPVYLIPRLKGWVADAYVPGTPVAITEYNWGAEAHINGATTQADVLGIFGAQGLDMANRWTVPSDTTPTFKAMQMYRNYDGAGGGFGDTSVAASAPDPDTVSAFAALRASDGALTVMVINKALSANPPMRLTLGHFTASGAARRYRLTAANTIAHLPALAWSAGALTDTLPAQSVTLYVLPK